MNSVINGTWGGDPLSDFLDSDENIYSLKITEPHLEEKSIFLSVKNF
ncbi:hypothetical protein OVS_02055 [Mycoplasma ovis str. Michigan]|uniref:Uncharacterized protein n=1 Tax=Mycoplasma ovis str. Michigan TaxID=1415773 RepID=A0ABM5P1G3_9MOLU|nr:hypothetical protein OVS_02055 [Mycoplasma ovis str. Michigan]